MIKRFLTIAILTCSSLQGLPFGPHSVYLGPEFSYVKRTREGGSHQSAFMYGGHFLYQRLARNSLYWAFDAYYTTGDASGKTGSGKKIKSTFTDAQLEGRFGFTFHLPYLNRLFLTPYGGYGTFYGKNKFRKPSPITCELNDWFEYACCGGIVTFCCREDLTVGADFRGKYMLSGYDRISHDPEHENVKLDIECMWQYEIDFPIEFIKCVRNRNIHFRFVPFYRFRHFGGKPNYPFDFFETKFQIYGIQLLVKIGF